MKLIDPAEVQVEKKVQAEGKVQVEKKEQVVGELLFEVSLPSKGKHGYPEILLVRPLKVADVKPLIATRILNEIEYIRRVIEAVGRTIVKPEGFDVRELTLEDLLKLILAHRVNSFGRFFDLVWECPLCGKGGQVTKIDLINGVAEKELAEEYPGDFWELRDGVKVRMPRVSVFFKEHIKGIDDISEVDLVDDAVVGASIDDLELKEYVQVVEFIEKWRGYGVQRELKLKCSACKEIVEIPIPFFLFLARK